MRKNIFIILIYLSFFSVTYPSSLLDSLESKLLQCTSDSEKVEILISISENLRPVNYEKALERAKRAKEIADESGNLTGSARSSSQQGLAYYYQGNYEMALNAFIQAMHIYENAGNKSGIAITLNDIGNVYRKNGDHPNALESFLKAEKLFTEINDPHGIAICFDNTGVVYSEMNENDKALDFFLKSLSLDRKFGLKADIPYSLIYAAGVYSLKGNYSKAIEYYEEALKIRQELNDKTGLAINLNDMGELFLLQKKYQEAEKYFERALKLAVEIKYKDLTRHIYQMLSELYAGQGDFEKAYHHRNLSAILKDEIFNDQKSKQLTEMQTKYETEKKEKEIAIREMKINDQQMKLSQRNIYIGLLAVGLISIAVISLLVYRQQKLKQRQLHDHALIEQQNLRLRAIIEGEEKERIRLARDLHDGLGQVLSTVKLNLSGVEGNVSPLKEKQWSDSMMLVDEACTELRNISHNLMPGALLKLGLVPALKEFTDKINNTGTLKIHLQTHGLNKRLQSFIETGLYRILQELLNNIIKYADAENVTLQIIKDENLLTAMVEDDGCGFDKNMINTSTGIGWKNISSRVQFLNGTMDVDSQVNRGTTVTIEIPIV